MKNTAKSSLKLALTRSVATLAVILAIGPAAQAQTRNQAPPDARGCTPQERSSQALRDTGKTSGIICPPDIDPAMKAPTPSTGDSSVIPPPGSPGGNPGVQPK